MEFDVDNLVYITMSGADLNELVQKALKTYRTSWDRNYDYALSRMIRRCQQPRWIIFAPFAANADLSDVLRYQKKRKLGMHEYDIGAMIGVNRQITTMLYSLSTECSYNTDVIISTHTHLILKRLIKDYKPDWTSLSDWEAPLLKDIGYDY